jgi:DNA-binding NarL/FixJ family response regulator
VDLSLPDQNGIGLISEMLDCRPGLPILVISMHSKIEYVVKTIRAGAMGYFFKKSAPDNLIKAIETLRRGEYYLDGTLSNKVAEYLKSPIEVETEKSDSAYERLTEKEKEIMKWVVGGTSRRAIAEKLYISPKTVENHVSKIMKKLDIHNVYEMLRYSMKLRLIDVDLWE